LLTVPTRHRAPPPGGRRATMDAANTFAGHSTLQRYFKVSPPSVHQMVLTLQPEGFIRRQPGVARSIEMLIEPERLPVLR
jgi:hypothetical protein